MLQGKSSMATGMGSMPFQIYQFKSSLKIWHCQILNCTWITWIDLKLVSMDFTYQWHLKSSNDLHGLFPEWQQISEWLCSADGKRGPWLDRCPHAVSGFYCACPGLCHPLSTPHCHLWSLQWHGYYQFITGSKHKCQNQISTIGDMGSTEELPLTNSHKV